MSVLVAALFANAMVMMGNATTMAAPAPTTRTHVPIASGWTFRKVAHAGHGEEPWLAATVPGCVHTDLLAAGKIGDPFFRLNEKDQQWIEHEAWE